MVLEEVGGGVGCTNQEFKANEKVKWLGCCYFLVVHFS